jgi:hypothetical protein
MEYRKLGLHCESRGTEGGRFAEKASPDEIKNVRREWRSKVAGTGGKWYVLG